jgi:hypothetical protein
MVKDDGPEAGTINRRGATMAKPTLRENSSTPARGKCAPALGRKITRSHRVPALSAAPGACESGPGRIVLIRSRYLSRTGI